MAEQRHVTITEHKSFTEEGGLPEFEARIIERKMAFSDVLAEQGEMAAMLTKKNAAMVAKAAQK